MELYEQNEIAGEVEKLLNKKLKGTEFCAIVAVEKQGDGFAFAITSLRETSNFRSCSLIVTEVTEKTKELSEKFKIPSDARFKSPVEPK